MEQFVLDMEKRTTSLRQNQPGDATISLRPADDNREGNDDATTIQYTDPSTPIRMLGVHMCPDGDFTTHLEHMKRKSETFSKRIRSSRITAPELLTFLKTTYGPSMMYSLPALSVPEEQMSSIQTELIATVLNKLWRRTNHTNSNPSWS
jgi:hypothetical protein